jgi:putative transcriptional regulator
MPKIISKALQARLNYQARVGRKVSLQDVSDATGITKAALSRIERGETERVDFDTLSKLCAFYGVGVGDILEFDPNGRQTTDYAEIALQPA